MTEATSIRAEDRRTSPLYGLTLWVAAGMIMILCARFASVSRTQEARVLETAREMLGRPFVEWMIPHTNGDVRLHKPPLAYWLSAGAFKALGVSAWAGRVPAVISGWLTLGVTFQIARRFFGRTPAYFAAASLLGSWIFFKFTLLAETDTLATLFVTAGICAVLRAVDNPRDWKWQHAIALCMALAVLAKGPPAAYIALFYVALCACRKTVQPIKWFFLSGAFFTLLIIALPWFIYVAKHVGAKQLLDDLKNSAEGGKGHAALPHVYVPMFALGIAPWTAVWAVAIAAALRHVWRRVRPWQGVDPVFTLLLWGVIIGLPLMGWGNKQIHYLLPLMPPTMILVGYGLSGAIDGRGRFHSMSRVVLAVMVGVLFLLPLLPPIVARVALDPPEVRQIDWLACCILIIVASCAFWRLRGNGWAGTASATTLLSVALMATVTFEAHVADRWPTERLAEEMLRVHPGGHFVFRSEPSLSLCFAMGRTIPVLDDLGLAGRADDRNTVCLERVETEPKSLAPAGYVEEGRIGRKGEWLRVYIPLQPVTP